MKLPRPQRVLGKEGVYQPFQTVLKEQEKLKTLGRISGLEKFEERTNEDYKEKRKTEAFKTKLVKCARNVNYHSPTKNKKLEEFQTRASTGVIFSSQSVEMCLCWQDNGIVIFMAHHQSYIL